MLLDRTIRLLGPVGLPGSGTCAATTRRERWDFSAAHPRRLTPCPRTWIWHGSGHGRTYRVRLEVSQRGNSGYLTFRMFGRIGPLNTRGAAGSDDRSRCKGPQ